MAPFYLERMLVSLLLVLSYSLPLESTRSQLLDCTKFVGSALCFNLSHSEDEGSPKQVNQVQNESHQIEVNELCAVGKGNNITESGVVCIPSKLPSQYPSERLINVYIKTDNNTVNLEVGSPLTLSCRFNTSSNIDIKFNLGWLQTIKGDNKSISTQNTDSEITIEASTVRIWTVRQEDGLELRFNEFRLNDTGRYFCRAVSHESGTILGEAVVYLATRHGDNQQLSPMESNLNTNLASFSQENLSKLLPSLKIIPSFCEVAIGEVAHLICITTHLDPDPQDLEWTFESSDDVHLVRNQPVALSRLPQNTTVEGNILTVQSMSADHVGLYKCTTNLSGFNLSVQAASQLALRPSDSAPLVFVSPEIIKLSVNHSLTIECIATGYPPPQLTWYRVEDDLVETEATISSGLLYQRNKSTSLELELLNNIEVEHIPYKDIEAYCTSSGNCWKSDKQRAGQPLTGISMARLHHAKAQHQGQYVCRAANAHGSNQASTIVDVELKEPPVVVIPTEFKERTIELPADGNTIEIRNVTFKCSIESGRPQVRLRWLRMRNNGDLSVDNLDIHDLSKVSSATAKISTWFEDDGKTLALLIGAISVDEEGDYICVGENEWGRDSAIAHLFIRRPISIRITQSSPMVAQVNSSFHLDCIATGHPLPLDIEWSQSDRGTFFSLISRGTNMNGKQERAILKFDRVTFEDSGEYTCNARDSLNGTVILRDTIMVLIEDGQNEATNTSEKVTRAQNALLPKLMIRPTKVDIALGSNVTFDCLAISGLQPTIVEWIAPSTSSLSYSSYSNYNNNTTNVQSYYKGGYSTGQLLQFGSKLRILNATKAHEGVYQCRGRNKIGIENAPALLRLIDNHESKLEHRELISGSGTKTKLAKVGSNIELKCQVNGIEQLATSWSRDGKELPSSSVQIGHNLWIQNVSEKDDGLYICSARSSEPNKIIQAKINLLVKDTPSNKLPKLVAKIVASKNTFAIGDSITLECIVSYLNSTNNQGALISFNSNLDEIEQNVVWTNLHSGQSLFQDNVYLQNNLLIIYDIRIENIATYRCNYDELTQYIDYKLQISNNLNGTIDLMAKLSDSNDTNKSSRVFVQKISVGSQLKLECPLHLESEANYTSYYWTRGNERLNKVGALSKPLVMDAIKPNEANIYNCQQVGVNDTQIKNVESVIVQVLSPVARFTQKPVSFISLPSIAGADHQLEMEVKFLAEHGDGLMLFNGGQQQQLANSATNPQIANRTTLMADFISLGLTKGFLEFRFELGDGTTLLKSIEPISLNQWHKVVIERSRRGAVMWLDKQLPISNSSIGKFFNLNLNSVLFVGGHEYFLNRSRVGQSMTPTNGKFYGYSRGFQGCISQLRISRSEVNLMARTVSIGINECDKSECSTLDCNQASGKGFCQVENRLLDDRKLDATQRSSVNANMRCICAPRYSGEQCNKDTPLELLVTLTNSTQDHHHKAQLETSFNSVKNVSSTQGACESMSPCSSNGTINCTSLTSISFKCHCRIGFIGENCSQIETFPSETSVQFNQQAYLQLKFNNKQPEQLANSTSNATTNFARQISMIEQQNITFKLRTKSSYGLIFYTGQVSFPTTNSTTASSSAGPSGQTSKSMLANLLPRLTGSVVFDYLAIALIDGHVELSYELGSGVAIIRSSQRINDGEEHRIRVQRIGKVGKLIIDELHRYEGNSPGKLSMLNVPDGIHLGGLLQLIEMNNNNNANQLTSFIGCLSNLEINSLGPLNLIRSDHLTQVNLARNLATCSQPQIRKSKPYQTPEETSDDPDEMR